MRPTLGSPGEGVRDVTKPPVSEKSNVGDVVLGRQGSPEAPLESFRQTRKGTLYPVPT